MKQLLMGIFIVLLILTLHSATGLRHNWLDAIALIIASAFASIGLYLKDKP